MSKHLDEARELIGRHSRESAKAWITANNIWGQLAMELMENGEPLNTEHLKIIYVVYWKIKDVRTSDLLELTKARSEEDLVAMIGTSTVEILCPTCGDVFTLEVWSRVELYKWKNYPVDKEPCEDCEKKSRLSRLKKMPYKEYLKTDEWRKTRQRFLERAGHKCQLCNSNNSLHVHHNTYENKGEESDEDCVVLCKDCHAKFHDIQAVAGGA